MFGFCCFGKCVGVGVVVGFEVRCMFVVESV